MKDVLYLYGFVPADTPLPEADVVGLGGAAVRLVDLGVVNAVVSDLPASAYGAEAVEPRLEDLAWVGEQGMAHERIVVWFADHSEILPARLFSLYSGEPALVDAVTGRLDEVAASLRSFTGRREWNLKIAYDANELARPGADISPELERLDQELASAAPGRRYLLERRRAEMLGHEIARAARALAHELLDQLRPHAQDVRILPLTDSDETGTVVLNAALLVKRQEEPALRSRAEELYGHYTRRGMIVNLSGPWAPYRFVEIYGEA